MKLGKIVRHVGGRATNGKKKIGETGEINLSYGLQCDQKTRNSQGAAPLHPMRKYSDQHGKRLKIHKQESKRLLTKNIEHCCEQ